jgi:hypothetical protein
MSVVLMSVGLAVWRRPTLRQRTEPPIEN